MPRRTVGSMGSQRARARALLAGVLASGLLAGCAEPGQEPSIDAAASTATPDAMTTTKPSEPSPTPESSPSPAATRPATKDPAPRPVREPRRSYLDIPALDLRSVPVRRYVGTPDDAEGTRIQNSGPAASPRGPGGGVGPGEIGNYIVTAHRTSHTRPFRDLPALRNGDRVRIRTRQQIHVYEIVSTRQTSFRSRRSLAEQAAAVPGRPGAKPVRAMITLSTCATPEDHAAGNYWSDRFGNPEHRIDKVGVLVRTVAPRADPRQPAELPAPSMPGY